jgi:hypothetical protein
MQRVLADLKKNDTTRDSLDQLATFEEYNDMVGMQQLLAMEGKYKVDDFKAKLKK